MNRIKSSGQGFTLIEVVVALAILASTLSGAFFVVNRAISNTERVEVRVLASWVAKNAFSQAMLEPVALGQDATQELTTLYGVEFLVSVREDEITLETASEETKTVREISVEVAKAAKPEEILESFSQQRRLL